VPDVAAPQRGEPLLRPGLRLLGRYGRAHPLPLAISVAGAMVFAAMSVLGAIVLGRVTDDVIAPAFTDGDTSGAWGAAVAIMIVALLRSGGFHRCRRANRARPARSLQ
jgi:ABC-type multidrug transport system fused ATPase/permease subunit